MGGAPFLVAGSLAAWNNTTLGSSSASTTREQPRYISDAATALARPQNLLADNEPPFDLASLAAAYAYGIARNHPFDDGNKRTALVAARTFLILNGVDLDATQDDKFLILVNLAKGAIPEEELADWIRNRI